MSAQHLPSPSIWPVTLALGVSLAAVGVITSWVLIVAGAAVTVLAIGAWVADALREETR